MLRDYQEVTPLDRRNEMKQYMILLLLCFGIMVSLAAQPLLTCNQLQYSTAMDGASPYLGQSVRLQAVVTGVNFFSGTGSSNYGFFLSDPSGGAWSGIFVYNQSYSPAVGDMVELIGTVTEYYGFTELTSVTSYQVVSQNNPLPQASLITTGDLGSASTGEQWEGVLVKVQNTNVVTAPSSYQEFYVTDGSGNCQVDNQFFPYGHSWSGVSIGNSYSEIVGIVDYAYSNYALQPRSLDDMQAGSTNLSLSVGTVTTSLQDVVHLPINAYGINATHAYQSYHFDISFDPTKLVYQASDIEGTLSQYGMLNIIPGTSSLAINYSGNSILSGEGVLLKLNFTALNTGTSVLAISNAYFGNDAVQSIQNGSITINSNYNSPGDYLTVIQRPLMNIPAIQIPGETMNITCLAPQTTTGFNAWLLHGSKRINLPLQSATWQTNPNRWELLVSIPQVNVFELYDLEVNANGGIHDVSWNAVQVLPSRKSSYYFVHITDVHMPTRIFYPDEGYATDSLAVMDFRAVMDDINLIRPEFVLLTGDLVNEGELEGFGDLYVYGWAQKVLAEMEVPVYLTAGNHDIGGWNSTPPVAGSSRRTWWRYFGWSWLDNTDTNWPYHTQDYYFNYGNTLYIGLESYDNYDNWRPNIYGTESFTDEQMAWLNDTVNMFPLQNKVLFHHYDFQEELDLDGMGIDMALWGHIHYSSGSMNTQPYNLATASTCNGNRAYRVVRMNNDQLTPLNTLSAGASGATINVQYYPSNYAVADSVMAVIYNGQPVGFDNALIKFHMPAGESSYIVSGGILEQVDRSGDHNVCYVRVNMLPNMSRYVSIKVNPVSVEDYLASPGISSISSCFPNPVRHCASILLNSAKRDSNAILQVFNIKGQKVQEAFLGVLNSGVNEVSFVADSSLSSGVYYFRLKGSKAKPYRFVLVK